MGQESWWTGALPEQPARPEPSSAPLPDDELNDLRDDVAANPDDARTRLLAAALLQHGAVDEAQVEVRTVLADRPEDVDAFLVLGLVQAALREPDALTTLRRFLDVAPVAHPGRDVAASLLTP